MVSKPKNGNSKSEKGKKDATVFETGDIVLGKVKGFPQWPGKIIDAEDAPTGVQNQKPKGNKFCVRFFHSADYFWARHGEIEHLTKEQAEKFTGDSNKKGGDLMKAYQLAFDHADWEKTVLDNVRQAKKNEDTLYNDQVDELGEEDEDRPVEGSKKRKRKNELTGKKEEKETKKRKKENGTSTKEPTSKSKKAESSTTKGKESSAEQNGENNEAPTTDQSLAVVQSWRHKLQRAFLGKTDPKSEDMPSCATIFDDIERFDMQAEWLKETKLVKVLKRIATAEDGKVPRDSEFHFKERSQALINKWSELLGSKKDDKKDEAGDVTLGGDLTMANGDESAGEGKETKKEDDDNAEAMDTSDG